MDFPAEGDFISSSAEETLALGEKTGRLLKPGDIVALRGSLGAGKTVFTKGIARALEIGEEITSPTYTIISEYEGICPLYHMDAYRISGEGEFGLLGAEEMLYGQGVCVIEWAGRIGPLPGGILRVDIDIMEDGKRRIRCGREP
ncbi:MAG: tRNA (adenosine(37)-N6)-threonylcarbamoyltransferase complex ATPase subunit type 1 TsaE [Treponema sp.]|nr:tRNA (adenosine(37)-N6)-threonylcarbamoyltransferase complex ATPase subunit type 1 TsaE [Treponema sp.]